MGRILAHSGLPGRVIIGTISRGESSIYPRTATFHYGGRLVVFAPGHMVHIVELSSDRGI